jgi:hypothetical protein
VISFSKCSNNDSLDFVMTYNHLEVLVNTGRIKNQSCLAIINLAAIIVRNEHNKLENEIESLESKVNV